MGQTRPLFDYFRSFHNAKKNTAQIWDSNLGWQNGRRKRIHWAMAERASPSKRFNLHHLPSLVFIVYCPRRQPLYWPIFHLKSITWVRSYKASFKCKIMLHGFWVLWLAENFWTTINKAPTCVCSYFNVFVFISLRNGPPTDFVYFLYFQQKNCR